MFATAEKYVFLSFWQTCISIVNHAVDFMKARNIAGRRCYVGEQLILPEVTYFVVTPHTQEVANLIEIMIHSGFHLVWVNEFIGIAASNRIQERVKMVSPTKLWEEREPPKKLDIADGKLKNVFFLWLVFLTFCTGTFALELTLKKLRSTKNSLQFLG